MVGEGLSFMYKCLNGEMVEMTAEEVAELEALRASIPAEQPTEQDEINAELIKEVNGMKIDLGR